MISLEVQGPSPPFEVIALPKRMFNVEYREIRDITVTKKLRRLTFDAIRTVGALRDNISGRCGWEKDSFELAARNGPEGLEYFLDEEDVVKDVVMSDESRPSHFTFREAKTD